MLLLPLQALALPPIDDPVRTGALAPHDSAVVIGIESYFVLPEVPHATRDARALYDFLVHTRGIPADRVQLLDRNANREQILEAVSEASALASDQGRVWVYFAGHGAASPDTGERVLLGVDTQSELSTFRARSIAVSELRRVATASGAEALLILDTCYSGRGRHGASLHPGARFAVPEWAQDPQGRAVEWSAAGPDEWAGPLPEVRHGAFTYLVLGALRGWADGQLDGSRDGQITLDEAQQYVASGLRALGNTDQHPVLSGGADWVVSSADEPAPTLSAPRAPMPPPRDEPPSTSAGSATASAPQSTRTSRSQPRDPWPDRSELGWSSLDTTELDALMEAARRLPLPSPGALELPDPGLLDALMAEAGQLPLPGHTQPQPQPSPAQPSPDTVPDPVELQQLLLQLQQTPHARVRLERVQQLDRPLSAAQVGQILDLFPHPSHQVQVVRILAPLVVDPGNAEAIAAHCDWGDERRQIREVMAAYAAR